MRLFAAIHVNDIAVMSARNFGLSINEGVELSHELTWVSLLEPAHAAALKMFDRPASDWNVCQDLRLSGRHWSMGTLAVVAGDQYRIKAAAFHARAHCATSARLRVQFENLAKAYLRLAEQADRNELAELTYEPPPPRLGDSDRKR